MTTTTAVRPRPVRSVALPAVFSRAEAVAAGRSRHEVQSLSQSEAWHRLAAGVYCSAERWDAADRDERTRLTAVAVSRRWPTTALSHLSAAALLRLPLPLVPPRATGAGAGSPQVHATWLTAAPGSGVSPRRTATLVVEVAALPPGRLAVLRGSRFGPEVRLTGRARTVADCLRHLPLPDAVAIADAAGADGLSREQLERVLGEQARWPGIEAARGSLPVLDPRHETWLESVSFVLLAGLGVPVPEPQVEVLTLGGRLIGRVDGLWRDSATAGEADGWAKYRGDGSPSIASVERALRREKEREDALRDVGLEVVRWDPRGVLDPRAREETVRRLQRAFERGDPSRVRAHFRSTPLPAGW